MPPHPRSGSRLHRWRAPPTYITLATALENKVWHWFRFVLCHLVFKVTHVIGITFAPQWFVKTSKFMSNTTTHHYITNIDTVWGILRIHVVGVKLG